MDMDKPNMMNKKAKMLHEAAKECLIHASGSYDRYQWNMVVRRSQEAVELELKSLLALLGMDYPKDHDQAPILLRVLKKHQLEVGSISEEKRIEAISADLSRKRGPALQQEEGYDKVTAQKAVVDANYVLKISEKIKRELK